MNAGVVTSLPAHTKALPLVSDLAKVQRILLYGSFASLFLVAILGALLRAFPFISFPLSYKNLLHGHSHLAFGGWVMPVLLAIITKAFPEVAHRVPLKHWRNICFLLLFSALGMLVAFPMQGYGIVSIIFSTISVFASFYLAFVIRKAIPKNGVPASLFFLKAGLFYLVISSIGPFATGPLIALGKSGSPLYYNAIYFYLHFQYNGWFTFAVLAVLYKMLERRGQGKSGLTVFWLFHIACIPAYLLSVLWTQPPVVLNILGGLATVLQLAGVYLLLADARALSAKAGWVNKLLWLSLSAFALKSVLQFLSAFPSLAALAYEHRNFVIAYLHLVLLGCISVFALAAVIHYYGVGITKVLKHATALFIIAFTMTELLLVLQACGAILRFQIPHYAFLLFALSVLLVVGAGLIWTTIARAMRKEDNSYYG